MEAAASVTNILSKLMRPNLNDQEKLVLVKALNGVLIEQLDHDQSVVMGPYTHKILVVIEPMLIDEDDNTRVEGRKVIYNLSKAVGLPSMIAAIRPDIGNIDEDVRKMTAKAFSVVASALGIHVVLPFLKGVCQSQRSWETRQTGMKIVEEIALLMGKEVVPHLRSLVEIIVEHGLNDVKEEVRSIADLSLDALAEAARPDGVDIIKEIEGCLYLYL